MALDHIMPINSFWPRLPMTRFIKMIPLYEVILILFFPGPEKLKLRMIGVWVFYCGSISSIVKVPGFTTGLGWGFSLVAAGVSPYSAVGK